MGAPTCLAETTVRNQIIRWWKQFPDAVPVICCNVVVVVDSDRHGGGSDGVAALAALVATSRVIRRVGYSYPTLWRWMREGTFPMSFDVGSKTAWREDEIDAWLASRPRSNLKKSEG